MKLNKLSKLAALLAAGALAFGFASCDSGNDEYVPEIPTTWIDLGETADSSVTAKWTFASDADGIGPDEVSWTGKILTPEGTGATLTGGDPCMIKYVANPAKVEGTGANGLYVQAANKTASIEDPTGGASFILKTSNATNITVRAGGAGAAGATRIAVICYADGTPIIGKGSLGSSDVTTLHVKGAPAGTYKIYFNGSRIYEITTGETVSQPLPYTSNDELTLSAAPEKALEALIDTHTFTLTGLGDKDETLSAVWTSSNPKVATVKNGIVTAASANSNGKTMIRARIGMYYKEAEVEFEPCTGTIVSVLNADNLPSEAIFAHEKTDEDVTPVALKAEEKTAFFENEAVVKAFAPKVVGLDLLEASEKSVLTLEDFGFDKEMILSVQPKGDIGFGGGKAGLSWKDGKDGVCTTDAGKGTIDTAGWKIATITYKVTPTKTILLDKIKATSANGKNANDTILKVIVGENPVINVKTNSAEKNGQIYEARSTYQISNETEIKIEIWTCRNGNSFSLQDVNLVFIEK